MSLVEASSPVWSIRRVPGPFPASYARDHHHRKISQVFGNWLSRANALRTWLWAHALVITGVSLPVVAHAWNAQRSHCKGLGDIVYLFVRAGERSICLFSRACAWRHRLRNGFWLEKRAAMRSCVLVVRAEQIGEQQQQIQQH